MGDNVRRGQILVQMDETTLSQQEMQLKNLETEFNRIDQLYQVGGVSKSEWDNLNLQLEVARKSLKTLKENTQLASPIDGVVTTRNYDNGDLYGGQPILVVQKIAPVKLMYHKLAGMTGTAETEAGEFWDIYKLDVVVIPTNKPIARIDQNDRIYKTKREKYKAVIEEIVKLVGEGRPVLVGTTSVEISEQLSRMLTMRKIEHNVLNAKLHQKEADIVAKAGQKSIVTIATNMAGRGTDIKLSPEVREAGGLAIVGTERHESRRVDRQLRGRAGRQGDPGSSVFFISLEDNLMRLFGSDRIAPLMDKLGLEEDEMIENSFITKRIEQAQKKVEENHFGIRKRLLEYDDVMNKQRTVIYEKVR